MVFTSGDLPLSLLTPVTTNPRTSITTTNTTSPPQRTPKPLLASLPALLLVVKTVLSTRAAQGDDWLRIAASSPATLDLREVLRAAPAPVLSVVSADFLGELYQTALACRGTTFDNASASIAIDLFVDRLLNYGDVSYSVLITALVYLDRLAAASPALFINSANVHKLFGVAFMIAAKWHEDEYYAASFFARLIGVTVDELNNLEREFLVTVKYSVFVSAEQFAAAEVAFMTEAIDSPFGLSVFQRLRAFHVAGIDDAAEQAKTWSVFHPSPPGPGGIVWRPSSHGSRGPFSSPDKERLRAIAALAAIARAQLDHDFPKLSWDSAWLHHASRVYAESGVARLHILLRIAQGARASTVLPPLERRAVPHAYLSHSTPGNSIWGSGAWTAGEFGSVLGPGQPIYDTTGALSALNGVDETAASVAWQTFAKPTESPVDWAYGCGEGAYDGRGIALYASEGIWTTR